MKHFTLFILLLVLLESCSSKKSQESKALQLDSITADTYKKLLSPSADWSSLELEASNEEKHEFVKEYFPYILNSGDSAYLKSVYCLDFNNDGKKDFIYSGPGPVTTWTVVSITGDAAVFSESSMIVNMDIVNKKVRRLYLNSILSTGGPAIDGYSIIDIVYDDGSINFINRINCEEIGRLIRPKNYSLFDIEVVKDSATLRMEPAVHDSPYDYILELPGNQLGKLAKGAKATVIGQQMDSLGANWYFALISPQYKIKGYVYGNDSTVKSYAMGWVKASESKRN